MYKVFFNEQSICIDSNMNNSKEGIVVSRKEELRPLLFEFFDGDADLFLLSESPENVFLWLKDELHYIEAAGGIVETEDEELLFIYRLEFWDLPKGKIEKGESPEEAAYREIKEECGIATHQLQQYLSNTYHIYSMNGEMYLKKTFWYYFQIQNQEEELIPQTEESIERVSWLSEEEIELALLESYESIKQVYEAYKKMKIENI